MNGRKATFGLVLVVLGVLLLARSLHIYSFTFGELIRTFLPIFFIGAGIWFIIRRKKQEDSMRVHVENSYQSQSQTQSTSFEENINTPPFSGPSSTSQQDSGSSQSNSSFDSRASQRPESDSAGRLKYSKLIGDLYIDCAGQNIENVEVSSFIGDVEIKVHGAKFKQGLNRIVISHFIGDIRILIPRELAYCAQASNFIGDVEMGGKRTSGFSNSIEICSDDYETAQSKLYIASNSFIGDIRVLLV